MKKDIARQFVLRYFPNAICKLRGTGKTYYQVVSGLNVIGEGKTKENAWTAAYHNL